MSPVLSIIVVAYKSRAEISACLASLPRELDGRSVEIVVVDNFPGDGTSAFVRAEFPHVEVIDPRTNLGFGRANNLGYSRSSGECVLFLNPDTICSAQALAHCLRRVRAEHKIGFISPRLVLANGTMDLACRRSIPSLWDGFCRAVGLSAAFPRIAPFGGYNLTYLPEEGTYDIGAINGAFMMARRSVLDEVAEPRPPTIFDDTFFMYGDDLDLCIRVARAGYRIVYDGRVSITHLKGMSVAREYDRMSVAIFDANRDVFLKHFNPRGSRWVRWKYTVAFGLWKYIALQRARLNGYRRVKPL